MAYLDQCEIAHLLAQELLYQQFLTLEGLHSGVPTRTTPTVTPTTLRYIEQQFTELQPELEHENKAGFVPPLVQSIGNNQYMSVSELDIYSNSRSPSNAWHSSISQSSSDSNTRSTPPLTIANQKTPSRRNMGGRKPAKDLNISPEEEERRKIRRERNKAAAARCRKRRVDHTNQLIQETDELQQKKLNIQKEIQKYMDMQEELQYALDIHRNAIDFCRLRRSSSPPDIKPQINNGFSAMDLDDNERIKSEIIEPLPQVVLDADLFSLPSPVKRVMWSSSMPVSKPNRPNSLNVNAASKNTMSDLGGMCLTTPSPVMQFNFESLMVGGTGLTPVSTPLVPSCSTQQRNLPISIADITSPDTCGPPKLVSL